MLVSPRYEGPAIISIDGDADDQRLPMVRQRRRFETMLMGLGDDDWSSASRCENWTVQDVVAHLVGVNIFWHASISAGLAGAPTRVLIGFDPATTPALMVDGMRQLEWGEVLDQFVASNHALLDVISGLDDDGWGALAETPAGHVPIRVVAHHALWDCWVHERDIGLPVGWDPPAELDELGSCLRYAAALGPALAISAGHGWAEVCAVEAHDPTMSFVLEAGESVHVREGLAPPEAPCLRGDAVALVEGLSLRVPLPPSTPTKWLELARSLATAFDTEVPAIT
jgi:uncharacterized protein (TIGR03083 family)